MSNSSNKQNGFSLVNLTFTHPYVQEDHDQEPTVNLQLTVEEADLLNDILCDAQMHHQLKYETYPEDSEESDYHDKAFDLCGELLDRLNKTQEDSE